MRRSQVVVLLGSLAGLAAAAAGGWVAGARIISPAEVAARTAAPIPSPILVPIEERVLSTNIVTRGTARYGMPQPISVAPSVLKSNTFGLITTLPSRNAQFKAGDVLFTISGRPVFVAEGKVPAYRDFVPGISGTDVRQLQQALKDLGFDPGPADGAYDERTGSAVKKWYISSGFGPFGPTSEQLANVQSLELALAEGMKNKMLADSALAVAELALASAGSKARHAEQAATAEIQAGIAERDLALNSPQRETSRLAIEGKIEAARAALRAAEAEGELAIQTTVEAKLIGAFDARQAAERLDRLAREIVAAKRKLGDQLPLDEIIFIPALPVRVQEVTAVVGNAASGPVMSVTDNQITIHSSLSLEAAPLVKPGMEVLVDEPAVGIKTKGIVELVENTPGTHGVDGYHIYFAVRVDNPPVPLDGFSLRLTLPIKSTNGVVTAVPLSAVSLAADGSSRVQVDNNGKLTYVVVDPGLAADGYVEVTSRDEPLKPGQLVVVGYTSLEETPAQRQ